MNHPTLITLLIPMAKVAPNLNRTFFDLPKDGSDIETTELLSHFNGGHRLSWEQLLESDRVLIVAEAGVGKTHECQRQQRQMWGDGEAAFFVELAALATDPMENQFSSVEKQRFDRWLSAQTERATFFLDSIDELKLTKRSFELTLKRFENALVGNLARARVVLTTRPVAVDREIVQRWLPVSEPMEVFIPETYFADVAMHMERAKTPPSAPQWRFVALSGLDERQMRLLGSWEGVENVEALLLAIHSHHAHEFAKRPLDFIELCGDWKTHSQIRTHRDQIGNNIAVKLRARGDRPERVDLPPSRAREGATRLALASLLTRKFTIWHSADGDRGRGDSALDPAKVLSDWSDAEVKTLLERPLFGFATYGRVRFHNRSISEFLAAERLLELLRRGLSISALKRLLFAMTPVGLSIVKPTMQPVAAWLSLPLAAVRAEVLAREPSILLRFGDPESLDIEMRQQALERYVQVYGAGGWRGNSIPTLQVQRLASPELDHAVSALWSKGVENPEVRETLLELMGIGKMTGCADIAYGVATNIEGDSRDRLHGLLALSDLGDSRLPVLLDELSSATSTSWPSELAGSAAIHLFPQAMSAAQLLGVLSRLKSRQRDIGGISSIMPRSIAGAGLSNSDLALIRSGLMTLVEPTCSWNEPKYSITSGRSDLVPALLVTCRLQLERGVSTVDLFDAAALALCLGSDDIHASDETKALRLILSAATPEIREGVFWANDRLLLRLWARNELDAGGRAFRFLHHAPFAVDVELDSSWILAAIADKTRPTDERAVVLEIAIHLAQASTERLARLQSLVSLTIDSQSLSDRAVDVASAVENPPPPPAWMREHEKRSEDSRRKKAKALASWRLFWRELSENPDKAFSAEQITNTTWNLWRAMGQEASEIGMSGWNRNFLEQVFDRATADRLRNAMKDVWRQERPTVRSERPAGERNTYLVRWKMGLAGIYAESEDPSWAVALSAEEAELAARYALLDLNRLPPWLDAVIPVHSAAVESILGQELVDELQDGSAEGRHSILLQEIANSSPLVAQMFLPRVRSWVQIQSFDQNAGHPAASKLERAMTFLLEHGTTEDFEYLKDASLKGLRAGANQASILFWLPVLMRLDLEAAVSCMEKLAKDVEPSKCSDVVHWFSALFGRGNDSALAGLSSRPALLLRLTFLACRHVQIECDRRREGVFSPDARDHAEHARGALVNALLGAPGVEAWHAKMEFADSALAAHFSDRARAVAYTKQAEEWDAALFDEGDVLRLEHCHDWAPITRADMAGLLNDRLDELDDLLLQDASPRELWAGISSERLLRKELAGRLESLAKGAYVVNQEAVTGDENETDIRLRSTSKLLEGVIELKIGENGYSIPDLSSALRDQLVGKYMAPDHRRVGCLMISIASDRKWKHPQRGGLIPLEEVITLLREEADQLVKDLGYDALLAVKGLDLRAQR